MTAAKPSHIRPSWRVINSDAMKALRELDAGSIDAVITDPPYGIAYESRTIRSGQRKAIANDENPFVWWMSALGDLLTPEGCVVCFCRWDVTEPFKSALEWSGLTVRGQVIWDKVLHGMGDTARAPAPQHETIWFASKKDYRLPGPRPRSVVRHQRVHHQAMTHPTEKPVSLMAELVRSYCRPGGRVLDPFMGTGSTGVACIDEGRSFIGVEMDAGYCDIAQARLARSAEAACA